MVSLWSAFLSCDARDMCRAGPALARNLVAWLAFTIRPMTVFFLVPASFCVHIETDMYWVTRQDHPDYLAFKVIRDEVDRANEAWLRGDLSNDNARSLARALSARLREWEDQRAHYPYRLFSEEGVLMDGQECPPFYERDGFALLESERIRGRPGNPFVRCEYLFFVL
jgi:hypothetical protein